jgi:hypothetical protein
MGARESAPRRQSPDEMDTPSLDGAIMDLYYLLPEMHTSLEHACPHAFNLPSPMERARDAKERLIAELRELEIATDFSKHEFMVVEHTKDDKTRIWRFAPNCCVLPAYKERMLPMYFSEPTFFASLVALRK